MGLDVYVMPLWRFKVGDYRSPIEALIGVRPKLITGRGVEERPVQVSWLGKWRARIAVNSIRQKVASANGARVRWTDEGEAVYAQQSPGFESLRAYAKWLDCRAQFPKFTSPPEDNYYKHPAMLAKVPRSSYPHLVDHSCFNGYYLPCEFEKLVDVEPYLILNTWPSTRQVGSAPRLLRELEAVQAELRVEEGCEFPLDDPLVPVKAAYLQLREIVELSCQHNLPIIFCG